MVIVLFFCCIVYTITEFEMSFTAPASTFPGNSPLIQHSVKGKGSLPFHNTIPGSRWDWIYLFSVSELILYVSVLLLMDFQILKIVFCLYAFYEDLFNIRILFPILFAFVYPLNLIRHRKKKTPSSRVLFRILKFDWNWNIIQNVK